MPLQREFAGCSALKMTVWVEKVVVNEDAKRKYFEKKLESSGPTKKTSEAVPTLSR